MCLKLSSMFLFSRKLLNTVKDNTVSHTDFFFMSSTVQKASADPSAGGA